MAALLGIFTKIMKDNWQLLEEITEAALEKGFCSAEFKRYRYGSANWREVEGRFERAASLLENLKMEFHERFPLTRGESSVE